MAITEDQFKEVLKLFYEEKKSYKEISALFAGTTRNTIAGLIYRHRNLGKVPSNRYAAKPKRPRPKRAKKERKPVLVPKLECKVYELEPHQCRYPTKMSESNEQLFCAEPIVVNMYCQKHHDLCHTDSGRLSFRVKKYGRV